MGYKYEKELVDKAGEFIELLNKNGFQSGVIMSRDYMIKLEICKKENNYGNAVIYYKPSKNSFSLKTHEVQDETIIKEVQEIWNNRYNKDYDEATNDGDYHVYVDGSFMNNCVGYGFAVLKNNKLIKEESSSVVDPLYLNSRQVGGEIKAVEKAVSWAEKNKISRIIIYYDLANLEKWITGEYDAKNPMTKRYRDNIRKANIEINWKKVKSHTGDKWNDYVDELAKKGTEKGK